jgi:hypothetical protein
VSFLVLAAVPTELSGGRYPAPAWAILALGIATVVGAGAYLGVRWQNARSARNPRPPEEKR